MRVSSLRRVAHTQMNHEMVVLTIRASRLTYGARGEQFIARCTSSYTRGVSCSHSLYDGYFSVSQSRFWRCPLQHRQDRFPEESQKLERAEALLTLRCARSRESARCSARPPMRMGCSESIMSRLGHIELRR